MRGVFVTLVALEILGPKATAQDVDTPDLSHVAIQRVNARGSGCANGTVAANLSPDGEAMTLIFDDYSVEGGAQEDRLGKTRKDCNLQIAVTTPPGWTFSILSLTLRGYADLDAGVSGVQSAKYRLGRNRRDVELSKLKLQGEYRDDYEQSFDLPLASANWADCNAINQTLHLATSIAVKGDRRAMGGGVMTVDSLDGEMNQEYGIVWRRCDDRLKFVAATCRASWDNGRGGGNERDGGGRGRGRGFGIGNRRGVNLGHGRGINHGNGPGNGLGTRLNGRELIAQGRGRSAAEAMAKARQKLEQKCQKRAGRKGGSCVFADNSCRVL